jgi:hypothetical protein
VSNVDCLGRGRRRNKEGSSTQARKEGTSRSSEATSATFTFHFQTELCLEVLLAKAHSSHLEHVSVSQFRSFTAALTMDAAVTLGVNASERC